MNIFDFARIVLEMDSKAKRQEAVFNLQKGLSTNKTWNEVHKQDIKILIFFLESNSDDLNDLNTLKRMYA